MPDERPAITIDTICRLTEGRMGSDWYYNRSRWDTVDGYAPLDVVHSAWKTLGMLRAWDRITMLKATRNAQAPREALMPILDADVKEALGG